MNVGMKKIFGIISIIFLLPPVGTAIGTTIEPQGFQDYDPLVDINMTFEINTIRAFDKFDLQIPTYEKIDLFSDPDFFVKVIINDEEFTSDIWHETKYVYNPNFSVTVNVPDDEEFVDIKIQLYDYNVGINKLCDVSPIFYDDPLRDAYDAEIQYSIKSGHWFGDDTNDVLGWGIDPSGYGRLNGCDDGSIYQRDKDAELYFNIYQNDYDGDKIPYWAEVYHHDTDPTIDNTGEDNDNDGIPIEWEHKWGHFMWYNWHNQQYYHEWEYDDRSYDDHANLDPDGDALNNLEEYWTSDWGSDPFRKDVFIEMDQMQGTDEYPVEPFPNESKEILYTVFNRQNIVLHIDNGSMGGGEVIPFGLETTHEELQDIYWDYFLHGNESSWRRGVFHYGVMIHSHEGYAGAAFGENRFYITSRGHEKKATSLLCNRATVFASAYMHELGHTFAFWPIGGHSRNERFPILWWLRWRPYKSCMNYGYMYTSVDYSDGSRGKNDFDDWNRIDYYSFQEDW